MKKRFEETDIIMNNFVVFYDKETKTLRRLSEKAVIDLLNEQDQKIKKLEQSQNSKAIEKLLGKYQVKDLADLENRLKIANDSEELKSKLSKAIVPKFEITQEVYVIDTLSKNIYKTQISSIRIFDGYEFAYYCKYDSETQKRIYLEIDEENVFATKAEAQAKLDEIRRK